MASHVSVYPSALVRLLGLLLIMHMTYGLLLIATSSIAYSIAIITLYGRILSVMNNYHQYEHQHSLCHNSIF